MAKTWTIMQSALVVTFLIATVSIATAAERKHAHHGAHEHGHGELKLAIEGNILQAELELPGADVAGFEHAPRTKAQKAAVNKAISTLQSPAMIFAFPQQAKCSAIKGKTTAKAQKPEGKDDDHREFVASYVFRCAAVAKLSNIRLKLFRRFRSLKEIEVQAISAHGQIRHVAKRQSTRINLKRLFK